jgi:OmcA/MtrC family decaheme c-type cytochrome
MRAFKRVGLVVLLLTAAVGLTAAVVKDGIFTPFDKEFYLTDEQVAFIRPGFDVEIVDHAIADDGTVSVVYTIKDSGGLPLDLSGVYTPGSINISFLIASIPADKDHYVAYSTRSVTSSITGVTAIQPTSDSGGTTEEIEIGTYRYTFGQKLPQGYDRDATHTIGYYSQRDLSEFELSSPMDDGVVTFVPSGAEVEKIRQLSTDAACAKCHDFLQVHGRRHSLDLCIMCHYDGVIDPDTENSVDMPIMAHKIHAGASLEYGYTIIGYQNSVHDYSNVGFPQDLRYCDTCHVAEAAQSEAWYLKPTRAACGACHDSVNFASGENHAGGSAISDNFCANCHFPEGEFEFDASIKGAHTIPTESQVLTGVVVDILDVTSGGPGTSPTILFTVTDKAGLDIPLPELDRLRFQIAGPTTDYDGGSVREDALAAAVPAGSIQMESGMMATQYVYTCEWVIPEDAEGTYAVGPEARTVTTLYPGTSSEQTNVRDTSENPIFYFAATDAEPAPRRLIVDDAKCETCHRNLAFHGGGRHNAAEYCQFCHNPSEGAISLQFMVHRIHMGEELTRDFTIGRANFNEVRYPSNRANCEKCHLDGTYNVPVAGVLPMINEDEFFSPIPPNSTACLGCHDTVDAAAHAFTNISPFGEGCGACHAAEREFAVAKVHAD